jgi:hypothetical protein
MFSLGFIFGVLVCTGWFVLVFNLVERRKTWNG